MPLDRRSVSMASRMFRSSTGASLSSASAPAMAAASALCAPRALSQRTLLPRLLVSDGQTAVIGGLTVTQVSQNKSGIPVLVDLPVLGKLFGTTNKSEEKRDLLILITPHVLDQGERVQARSE